MNQMVWTVERSREASTASLTVRRPVSRGTLTCIRADWHFDCFGRSRQRSEGRTVRQSCTAEGFRWKIERGAYARNGEQVMTGYYPFIVMEESPKARSNRRSKGEKATSNYAVSRADRADSLDHRALRMCRLRAGAARRHSRRCFGASGDEILLYTVHQQLAKTSRKQPTQSSGVFGQCHLVVGRGCG